MDNFYANPHPSDLGSTTSTTSTMFEPAAPQGYFESLLYQDQHAFVAELEREQQEMQYHEPPFQMTGGEQQFNNQPPSATSYYNQNWSYDVPIDNANYYDAPPQPAPPENIIIGPKSVITNDPSLLQTPPAPQNIGHFSSLRDLFEQDPTALDALSPILVEELGNLGRRIVSLSIYLPIEQPYPGVYNLIFHLEAGDIYQSQFEIAVTDDYPAEAPVVDFNSLSMPHNVISKIKREISKLPFSFRVEDIVVEWAKVYFEVYRALMRKYNANK